MKKLRDAPELSHLKRPLEQRPPASWSTLYENSTMKPTRSYAINGRRNLTLTVAEIDPPFSEIVGGSVNFGPAATG
jgi:hypothetical protein